MSVTLGGIRNDVIVRSRIGSNGVISNDIIDPKDLDQIILRAMWHVTRKTEIPRLYATMAWPTSPVTNEVNVPPNCWKIKGVFVNGRQIMATTLEDLYDQYRYNNNASWTIYSADSIKNLAVGDWVPESTLNGTDFQYYIRQTVPPFHLGLVPALTTGTLVVYFIQGPTLPPGDGTALAYTDDMQEWIVYESVERVLTVIENDERAAVFMGKAKMEEEHGIDSAQNMQDDLNRVITPPPYGDHYRVW